MSGMRFSGISFLYLVLPDLRMARAQTPVRIDALGTSRPAGAPQLTYSTRWGLCEGSCLNHSCGPDQSVCADDAATLGQAPTGATGWGLPYTHLFVSGSRRRRRATITDHREGSVAHQTRAQSLRAARLGEAREPLASLPLSGPSRPPHRSWSRAWT
jgi:hypothetical protein